MEQSTPGETGQEPPLSSSNAPDTTLDSLSQDTRHKSLPPMIHAHGSTAAATATSTPPTPTARSPLSRRTSHTASPNLTVNPSVPPRRASSSASVSRPPSSPHLQRKSSRSSMGGSGPPDDQDAKSTPKRSISNLISGLRAAQTSMESIEEPEPLTAPQLATAHFTRELQGHTDAGSAAETVVVLHDACYGHRWSRLRTTKTQLSLIVERPERIQASVLGASSAYVRLGGHHAGAKQAPHPDRNPIAQPPFKIRKTNRSLSITSSYVTNVHGTSWMGELHGMCHSAADRLAAGARELSRESAPGEPEKETLHEGDLYLAPGSLDAFQGALGGVADAIDDVFSPSSAIKRAFVAVRPPGHHCSAEHPSGFCWLNNVHVGIEYAAQTYGLTHAAMLDFDLHHGDGSQAITWERNSKNNEKRVNAKPNSKLKLTPDIGYYSLHDINSYPCEMGDAEKVQAASLCIENAHSQSIWNVHLQPWKTDADFWKLYEEKYYILIEKAKSFLQYHSDRLKAEGKVRPKAAIFISAGFDASEWEGAGMQRHKVSVPTEFYARFTQDVVKIAQQVDGCEGRVISVLEGGYSDRALCSGVLSHLSGLCASPVTPSTNGVQGLSDLSDQMNGLSIVGANGALRYDQDWWSAANLEALEQKVNPPPPPQARKVRTGPQPTYATPTESFAYKVVDANKFARSISGTMRDVGRPVPTSIEQPPPEVDWIVATQELSKLLIPTDRQINSCTSEELAAPRVRKEHPPGTASTLEAAQPRQLRDRRTKAPAYAESANSDEPAVIRAVSRNESRASRRETIDVLPAPAGDRRASRRLSMGSDLGGPIGGLVDANASPVPAMPAQTALEVNGSMRPPPVPAAHGSQMSLKKVKEPTKPRKLASQSSAPPSPGPKAAVRSHVASSNAGGGQTDLDSLTTGLKKITLKVPATKEEHDRKQKEKVDAERRARALKGAETRRINAAAKKAAHATSSLPIAVSSAPVAPPAAMPMHGQAVADVQTHAVSPVQTARVAVMEAQTERGTVKSESAASTISSAQTSDVTSVAPGLTNGSIATNHAPAIRDTASQPIGLSALQPSVPTNGPTRPSAPTPHESTQHMATAEALLNHKLPSPEALSVTATSAAMPIAGARTREEEEVELPNHPNGPFPFPARPLSRERLPVFSSTGPIPFAPSTLPSIVPMKKEEEEEEEKSIWDVPGTPAR